MTWLYVLDAVFGLTGFVFFGWAVLILMPLGGFPFVYDMISIFGHSAPYENAHEERIDRLRRGLPKLAVSIALIVIAILIEPTS